MISTFASIRNMVCDQMELFADSFFMIPMARHLQGEMNAIEIKKDSRELAAFTARRQNLADDEDRLKSEIDDLEWCLNEINNFKRKIQNMR
jgi:hypothetical protein